MCTDGLIITYADDTCLLFSSNSWENVYHKTTVGVNKIFKELNDRKLTLNISKSVFVVSSIYNTLISSDDIVIHSCNTRGANLKLCNCQKITKVTRVKYLGLIIDWNLRWKIHIKNLVMRLRSIIFKLFKPNKLLAT